MVRIIVEGMDHDNTRLNYYIDEVNLPLETRILKTWGGKLAYRGRMYEEPVKDEELEEAFLRGSLEVTISSFPIFESTQTIVAEDRRIFHVIYNNKERLQAVLRDIFSIAGSFDNAYRQIEKSPGRFLRLC